MRTLDLEGSPSAMGETFGESCRREIHELYRLRVGRAAELAQTFGGRPVTEANLVGIAERSLPFCQAFDEDVYDELAGIAAGADLALPRLLAMNGLTDFWDAFAWPDPKEAFGGCTSCIVQADRSLSGHALCAQTWDLATDNKAFVIAVARHPTRGPATRSVTTVGCLSLMGINALGLAVGTTNIRTKDARPGVSYLLLLHRALALETAAQAATMIQKAHRAGGHYFMLVDKNDHAFGLEASATHAHLHEIKRGTYVHCNHCQQPKFQAMEADTPLTTSPARQARMETLLDPAAGKISTNDLELFLADREGGNDAIGRDDVAGISSNTAVVMEPATGTLRACPGVPGTTPFLDL